MPTKLKIVALALLLTAACRRDRVRGLDGLPDAPAQLDFGLLAVGSRSTMALPVTNNGVVRVSLGSPRIIEPFDVAQLPEDVEAGDQQNALITFAPVQPGDMEGDVVIETNSNQVPELTVHLHGIAYVPDLQPSSDRLDFGDVDVGSFKTLTLTLTNAAPVTLNPAVGTIDDDEFTVAPDGELGPVKAGAQVEMQVTFAPTVAGDRGGRLLVECPSCATRTVQLAGRGIARPVPTTCSLDAQPAELDFGPLDPGQTQGQTVVVSSKGDGACHVSAPYFAAGSDGAFSGSFRALELPPGASESLRVDFAPTAATALRVTGALVLVSNDVSHGGPIQIALGGSVNPPPPPPPPPGKLEVTPSSMSFTAQAPGSPAAQQLTLRNAGGSPLSWTASDDDAGLHLGSSGGTLQPGASASVDVSVDGQAAAGARSATISVSAGTAGSAQVPVSIVFTAAPPPPPPPAQLTVTPRTLSFSAEVNTAPPSQSITVGNSGGQDLSWTAASDDASLSVAPASGTLHASGSVFAAVSLAAQQFVGTRTQNIVVDAGAAGKATVAVTIEIHQTTPPPPPPQYGSSVWPKFHHDNGNTGLSQIDTSKSKGVARKVQLTLPPDCQSLSGIWRCGTYQASPSLGADGSIYQVGGDGNVYAVDATTMKVKWTMPVGKPMLASAESDITVVKSGHFFIHAHGTGATLPQFFKILDKGQTAELSWENTPAGYDSNGKRIDGFDSAPAIDYDGNLYLMNEDAAKVGTWDQRAVKQYDLDLSPKIQNMFTHGAALTTDRIAFWTSGGTLWVLDENARNVAWTAQDAALKNTTVVNYAKNAPMITRDGQVVTAFGWREGSSSSTWKFYTRLTAYTAGTVKKQLWTALIGPTSGVKGLAPRNSNVNADEELRYNLGVTSPAQGPDGTIYVGHADGLYAVDPVKHQVKWGYGAASVVSSPAVGADGTVYFGSMDGHLYAVKDGALKWQVKTKGQVNSSPAIGVDGTVYAMSDDGWLYAVK